MPRCINFMVSFPDWLFLSRTFHHGVGVVLSSGDTTATLRALLSAGGTRRDESIAHSSLDFLTPYADVERRGESFYDATRVSDICAEMFVYLATCVHAMRDGTWTPTVSIANYEISCLWFISVGRPARVQQSRLSSAQRDKKSGWNFLLWSRRAFLEMREWLRNASVAMQRGLCGVRIWCWVNGLMEVLGCT